MDTCGNCEYHGWLGMMNWCRHPDHVREILRWGGRCGDWLEWPAKRLPSETKATWPEPIDIMEGAYVGRDRAGLLGPCCLLAGNGIGLAFAA